MKLWKMAFAAAFVVLMFVASPMTASAAELGYWYPAPVAAPVVPVERPAFQPVYYNYGYAYHHGSACRNWWFRVHHRRLCG